MEAVRDRSALWQWGAELRCGSVGLHCNVAVSDCTAVEQCGTALRRGSVGLNCTVAVGGQGRLTPGCWRLPVPRCAGAYRGGGRGGPHPRLWAPPCSLTCGGVLRWGAPHPGLLAPPLCRVLRGCTAVGGGGRLTPGCWRLPVPRVEGGGGLLTTGCWSPGCHCGLCPATSPQVIGGPGVGAGRLWRLSRACCWCRRERLVDAVARAWLCCGCARVVADRRCALCCSVARGWARAGGCLSAVRAARGALLRVCSRPSSLGQ